MVAPALDYVYLTTAEAAGMARVTPDTIRRWIEHGRLTRYTAGREIRVKRAELEAMMTPGKKQRRRSTRDLAKLSPEALADRWLGNSV